MSATSSPRVSIPAGPSANRVEASLSPTLSLTLFLCLAAAVEGADAVPDFESNVRPILAARCEECHGENVAEAGLRLDSRRAVLRGSDAGPVVVPGDAAGSRLIAAARSGHWAFTPPVRHPAPELAPTFPAEYRDAWRASPIDRFLAAGLSDAGLGPAPPAAPRDLVRRLSFDLTGLPPTAAEADEFCANPSDEAYRALVDRLLASRGHAEHCGPPQVCSVTPSIRTASGTVFP